MSRKKVGIAIAFVWFLLLPHFHHVLSEDRSLLWREAIQAEKLLRMVRDLASPEMEGRAAGTDGEKKAAQYIAEEFRTIGIEPLGDQGRYFQTFEISTGTKLGSQNRLVTEIEGKKTTYHPEVSFVPFAFSDNGNITGGVVFAGYGITAPELQYDDYAGLNAKDKIVLVMTHEPQEKNDRGPFRKPQAFHYTELRYKVTNAREHGAKGIIVVTDPNNHEKEKGDLMALRGGGSASAGIVGVHAVREVAETILLPSSQTLSQLQKEIDESFKPRSFVIPNVTADLEIDLVREKGQARNVIGILPGRDPHLKGEAIVIGAHYDGLGRGGENSLAPDRYGAIHPGADDNASGVAGVLTLAEAFARTGAKRTVIFIAFSGEEIGLLGSSHYVRGPTWPLEKTYAMINLDGIGRLKDGRLYILGVDSAGEFRSLVEGAGQGLGFQLSLSGDAFGPSDHTSFYVKGKPVLMFFTGPHPDYHRPSDTADKVNGEGMEKVVRLVYNVVAELASRSEPLAFVMTKGESSQVAGERGGGYGAYLGSIPDFAESPVPGVHLSGVRPGSPAEKIGLQAGDIVVGIGGVTVRNLHDLLYALRTKRPGDQVEVIYLREGKELKARATLGERR